MQAQNILPNKMLIEDVSARWGSKCATIEIIISKNMQCVQLLLKIIKHCRFGQGIHILLYAAVAIKLFQQIMDLPSGNKMVTRTGTKPN